MHSVPETAAPTRPRLAPVFAPTPSPSRRTPAQPERLFFRECLGSRILPQSGGFALRLMFSYRSDRGRYAVEAAVVLSDRRLFTGEAYVRGCTCPDHQKRRGAAAPHSRERMCKHMQLVTELVRTWAGRAPERPEWLACYEWPEK